MPPGRRRLAAIVAGYEVICRVALALPAGGPLSAGLSPDGHLRRLRSCRCRCSCVRARCRGRGIGTRYRTEPDRGQPAVPSQRCVDQEIPGGLVGHGGSRRSDVGKQRIQGRRRCHRRRTRLFESLCTGTDSGAGDAGSWNRLRVDGDRREALSLLPLRSRRHRCGLGPAQRTRSAAARNFQGGLWFVEGGHVVGRSAGAKKGGSAQYRRWPVQRAFRAVGRAGHGSDEVG